MRSHSTTVLKKDLGPGLSPRGKKMGANQKWSYRAKVIFHSRDFLVGNENGGIPILKIQPFYSEKLSPKINSDRLNSVTCTVNSCLKSFVID